MTKHTERQILDFYHAAEYLTQVADAQFARDPRARKQWLNDACSSLKHDQNGPQVLIDVMQGFLASQKLAGSRDKIKAALTYFKNQQPLMKYAEHLSQNLPLGSGVTEAACKTIVKQRLCCSGMKWKEAGAAVVLSLRTLSHSIGRANSSGARSTNMDFLLPLDDGKKNPVSTLNCGQTQVMSLFGPGKPAMKSTISFLSGKTVI